jgi:hypothetical protein
MTDDVVLRDTLLVSFRCVADIFNVVKFKGCSAFSPRIKQTACEIAYWCGREDERATALINLELPTRKRPALFVTP